jgi:SAF domain
MTTVLRKAEPPTVNGTATKARVDALRPVKPPSSPTRRRWGRFGAGAAAASLGAWVFGAMYLSAEDRTDVLVVNSQIARYATITRADLKIVRISSDTEASTVGATRIDEVVGRIASTDLPTGALLTDSGLLPVGDKLLKGNEAVVGVLLSGGDSQMTLRRGARVALVVRPAVGGTGTPVEVKGWVFDSSAEAVSARERPVEVAVARDQAAMVSAAAADKRVTLVILPE